MTHSHLKKIYGVLHHCRTKAKQELQIARK